MDWLQLAQAQSVDGVVGVFAQYQGGPRPGGQDVLDQVGPVDGSPDVARRAGCLLIGQTGVVVEVRCRIGERTGSHRQKTFDVPLFNILDASVDVDREVEKIRDHQARAGLQDVETLKNQNVRVGDHVLVVGDDVVDQMGVHRRADLI